MGLVHREFATHSIEIHMLRHDAVLLCIILFDVRIYSLRVLLAWCTELCVAAVAIWLVVE